MKGLARQELEAILNELAVLGIDCTLTDFSSIIAFIVKERMSDPIEVYTNLMRTSCFKATFHYGNIAKTFKDTIMSHCMLAIVSVREYLEPHTVIRVPADISYDRTFVLLDITPNDCYISAFN
jgi:hypothetical protein